MNPAQLDPDGYQKVRDVREILQCEAYTKLQKFLLDLHQAKDLRAGEVVTLLLDAAKVWNAK